MLGCFAPDHKAPANTTGIAMGITTKTSYCRFCHAGCAIEVDVDDNTVVAVRGDHSNTLYKGFTCPKGRELPRQHNHPERLLQSFKKQADGSFAAIDTQQAIKEIAERIDMIVQQHGPRSIATYAGTACFQSGAALSVIRAFHEALQSPSFYTSVTIDQPAKVAQPMRFGTWAGGFHSFDSADVVMILGNNPMVSNYGPPGSVPGFHPYDKLKQAKQRGTKIICVDPRRTPLADESELHLQINPGTDSLLLAAIIRFTIDGELFDRAFCEQYVSDIHSLRQSLEPFTTDFVAIHTGLNSAAIEAAARLFAAGPRGIAVTGTGTNMAPNPSLTEHLVNSLNILCGRCNRAGERVGAVGLMTGLPAKKAQVAAPDEHFSAGAKARVKGLHSLFGEMPTATLCDEILTAGDGQIKVLINAGGNPALAFPDQLKTVAALKSLPLLVSIDPHMGPTSQLSDYVIAPTLSLERVDVTMTMDIYYEQPYSHYTPAVVKPRGDVIEEWRFFHELAKQLGLEIELAGGKLSANADADEAFDKITANAKLPLSRLRAQPGGAVFDDLYETVAEADPDNTLQLQLNPDEIKTYLEQLYETANNSTDSPPQFPLRLISRREKNVFNSVGPQLLQLRRRIDNNRAHIHPEVLTTIGVGDGDTVEIESPRARIIATVSADDRIKKGVVSIAHCWGNIPEKDDTADTFGTSVARLVDSDAHYDPVTGIPVMSAIPVRINPLSVQDGR